MAKKIRKDIENVKKGDSAIVANKSGIKYEGEIISLGSKNIKLKVQSTMYGEAILKLPRIGIEAFIRN